MIEQAKILIVDDDARNLDVLEAMLASSECTLVRAESADAALLALLRDEFAAMILDIKMPGMNGIELANLIKQRRRTQHVPILFLTAHLFEDEDILRGYGVGAVDYLSKPVKADILRSKISVFIELHRQSRELAILNDELQREVAARRKAQENLQQINVELELRVAERTAALNLAHRGVQENEERLRMAMGIAEIAAWEWDVHGGRMTWSADPESVFGFPAGSFGDDRRITRVLHPDDRVRVEQTISNAVAAGSSYECEYRVSRPDGASAWITERGHALRGEDGVVERVVGVSRDVSAQRRAEQAREQALLNERRARDEAERQSRIKDEFLATLSHELRTPMNAILGWLSMLAKGEGVRDPGHAIAAIQRNAQVQAKLIEDLLEMNKLASGTIRLDLESMDLEPTLNAAIESVRPTADTKGVQLSTHISAPLPPIQADARRVQQILWNLVQNGVKFTRSGGTVDVHVSAHEDSVRIVVKDTGEGIPPDFLPFVFDRFRQAEPSAKGSSGLGIGLSIVKHLVELHGGSISVSSPGVNGGSTFTISLPLLNVERIASATYCVVGSGKPPSSLQPQ